MSRTTWPAWGPLRLLVGGASALLGLLAVFPAPTTLLWMAAIGVTEWGHLLALVSLLPLLPGWRRSPSGRVGGALGLLAALLALTPLLRALLLAQQLPGQLNAAFGEVRAASNDTRLRPAPLLLTEVVAGVPLPDMRPQTLTYSSANGQNLQLDLFQPPAANGPAPCVIVIHGGSWQSGERGEFPQLNRYLAARGYAVASISYRLAPTNPFPAAYDDVQAAIGYLQANAAALGIDANQLVLLGRSAGAQLALLAGYRGNNPAIRGVVGFYGPADLRYGYANPANPWVIDSRGTLAGYLGGSPDAVGPA
nr:alpha/beta hydrolase [Chloroflexaceae bacterium]